MIVAGCLVRRVASTDTAGAVEPRRSALSWRRCGWLRRRVRPILLSRRPIFRPRPPPPRRHRRPRPLKPPPLNTPIPAPRSSSRRGPQLRPSTLSSLPHPAAVPVRKSVPTAERPTILATRASRREHAPERPPTSTRTTRDHCRRRRVGARRLERGRVVAGESRREHAGGGGDRSAPQHLSGGAHGHVGSRRRADFLPCAVRCTDSVAHRIQHTGLHRPWRHPRDHRLSPTDRPRRRPCRDRLGLRHREVDDANSASTSPVRRARSTACCPAFIRRAS